MTMWIETSVDRRGSEGKCKNAARLIKRNGMGLLQIDGLGCLAGTDGPGIAAVVTPLARRLTSAATGRQKMAFGNTGC